MFTLIALMLTGVMPAMAQGVEITGVVLDAQTEDPLIGATVKVKDSTIGDATNLDGEFCLKNVKKDATPPCKLYRLQVAGGETQGSHSS